MIDPAACCAAAVCTRVAPAAFEIVEGKSRFSGGPQDRAAAEEAARRCPYFAIRVLSHAAPAPR